MENKYHGMLEAVREAEYRTQELDNYVSNRSGCLGWYETTHPDVLAKDHADIIRKYKKKDYAPWWAGGCAEEIEVAHVADTEGLRNIGKLANDLVYIAEACFNKVQATEV